MSARGKVDGRRRPSAKRRNKHDAGGSTRNLASSRHRASSNLTSNRRSTRRNPDRHRGNAQKTSSSDLLKLSPSLLQRKEGIDVKSPVQCAEKRSDPENGYEQLQPSVIPCEEQDEKVEHLVMDFVTKARYYHGKISTEDCISILKDRGDFLVRAPEVIQFADKPLSNLNYNDEQLLQLVTVCWSNGLRDIPITAIKQGQNERIVTLNNQLFRATIGELIREHMARNIPVDNEALLLNSVPRPIKEIARKDVICESAIGSGAYGMVYSGKYMSSEGTVKVAIKMRKICGMSKDAVEAILMEAKLMTSLNHRDIVKLYGLSTDETSIWIIMEYIPLGSLDTYIQKNPNTSHLERWSFCWDVCNGLMYLHQNRVLHRDLAARNCLVDVQIKDKSERKVVKISDFGMSRQGDCFQMTAMEYAPIRWEAPEIFVNAIFTKWSDVWAFGMVIYEVFTGMMPFYEYDTNTIRERIQNPEFRPSLNDGIPAYAKETMKICWQHEMRARRSMRFHSQNMVKLATSCKKSQDSIISLLKSSKNVRRRYTG